MAGTFRIGPATVQSMYAPELAAYSAGAVLKVSPSAYLATSCGRARHRAIGSDRRFLAASGEPFPGSVALTH